MGGKPFFPVDTNKCSIYNTINNLLEEMVMEIVNKPVEMISFCAIDGALRPLRFRYEDERRQARTVRIREILSIKQSTLLGIPNIIYLCRAMLDGRDHLFELRYAIHTHTWVLHRVMQ